ncbi:MAG: xylulokinase, partial [Anaerolineales bacterium]|nr:xylulokinase [Anaerolineales bacterium]
HSVPGRYHLMAVTLSAGGAFRWLRDLLGRAYSYDQLTALAAEAPLGAEGLLFLPYLTGERTPHLDPYARGAFIGLTARHGVGHLARAVMEGVVFALADGVQIMRGLNVPIHQIRATGGGGKSALWRAMQADIYGGEVVTLAAEEGPAYGAALLAGVGAGVFADVSDAVARGVRVTGVTTADPERAARYTALHALFQAQYPALRSTMHTLGA